MIAIEEETITERDIKETHTRREDHSMINQKDHALEVREETDLMTVVTLRGHTIAVVKGLNLILKDSPTGGILSLEVNTIGTMTKEEGIKDQRTPIIGLPRDKMRVTKEEAPAVGKDNPSEVVT